MSNVDEDIKVALLGDEGVGKTSIISSYCNINLKESMASYGKKIIKVRDKTVELNLWDTAGEEKFISLGKNFYRNAFIVCLVYDITNKESFENLKTKWYKELKKNGEKNTILAVVGNKSDLYEQGEVEDDEAKEFAEEIGATFQLTSPLNNGGDLERFFKTLVERYFSSEFRFRPEFIERNQRRAESFKLGKEKTAEYCKKGCC